MSEGALRGGAGRYSYDLFKEALVGTGKFGGDDTKTHLLSSALGGTVAVTLVAPIDIVKSRVQSSRGNIVSPGQGQC